jgi:hypothetical protein
VLKALQHALEGIALRCISQFHSPVRSQADREDIERGRRTIAAGGAGAVEELGTVIDPEGALPVHV